MAIASKKGSPDAHSAKTPVGPSPVSLASRANANAGCSFGKVGRFSIVNECPSPLPDQAAGQGKMA